MHNLTQKKTLHLPICLAIIGAFLLIIITLIGFVPVEMDESVAFRVISCEFYDNAKYHIFREPCANILDLNFLGISLKRAYWYTGSLSSYLFYPFFLLFPKLITQQLVGIVFFIIFIGIIYLLEKDNKIPVLVIFGLSFPILYHFIHDTGPVRYGLTICVLSPLLVRYILQSENTYFRLGLNVLLGILVFLGVEDKPFFLYIAPSVALLTLAYAQNKDKQGLGENFRYVISKTWVSIITFLIVTLAYLFVSKTSSGEIYFFALKSKFSHELTMRNMVFFFLEWQKFSHKIFEVYESDPHKVYFTKFAFINIPLSLSFWFSSLIVIGRAYFTRKSQFFASKTTYTLLAFFTCVAVFAFTQNTWAGHHFIYTYTFALLAVCQSIPTIANKLRNHFLFLYSVFSIVLALQLLFLKPIPQASWERYKVFDYLQQESVAKNYVIDHLNYGTYYISALYGDKEQLVIYTEPLNNETANQVMKIADKTNRKILCVVNTSFWNLEQLSETFSQKLEFEEIKLSTKVWKVFVEK